MIRTQEISWFDPFRLSKKDEAGDVLRQTGRPVSWKQHIKTVQLFLRVATCQTHFYAMCAFKPHILASSLDLETYWLFDYWMGTSALYPLTIYGDIWIYIYMYILYIHTQYTCIYISVYIYTVHMYIQVCIYTHTCTYSYIYNIYIHIYI